MGTGEQVANVADIVPCYMIGDGSAIEFVVWDNTPNGPCLQGGSNDADPEAWLAHFICRTGCSECLACCLCAVGLLLACCCACCWPAVVPAVGLLLACCLCAGV
jgi:hypothetical protein